ncbi:MAG: acyl-CoA dehydrogenase family protein [Acidimicrobiia bacterium]|nr:acyl-CoA dehydrogenase family protein [Acidimicrobiia bacterium]
MSGMHAEIADPNDVVGRARKLADELLFPLAQDVDRGERVPAESLTALADAGMFGVVGPRSHGGFDLEPAAARRTLAAIGSGCGATFFVWAQHHTTVRTLRSSSNSALVDRLLAAMCAGDLLAGVAFAHVRRPGPPAVLATRGDGGWVLSGHMPWTTSWGLADWFSIAAVSEDGELVWSMLSADDMSGVAASPLALPVLGATGTVALTFDRCFVPDDHVAATEDADRWRALDRIRSSIGQPAVLGVAERAIRLLDDAGESEARDAADRLRPELASTWERDDDLLRAMMAGEEMTSDGSDHRAACIDLARRSTTALLAAVGGRGMDLGHPAQRLAREADFYVVQAQTPDGRTATLRSV